MTLPINQFKKIEEKLRIYDQPFIDISLIEKLRDKFAPKYRIESLCTRGLLVPIMRGKLYLNLLSTKRSGLLGTTILAQYGKEKIYMVGGLYLYNQYHFTDQLADRITVYNTSIHGKRIIAGYKFIFHKMRPSFFRGAEEIPAQGYGTYKRMTVERALIQLIKDSKGNMEYKDDIYQQIENGAISSKKLISLSKKYTSKKTQALVYQFLQAGQIL